MYTSACQIEIVYEATHVAFVGMRTLDDHRLSRAMFMAGFKAAQVAAQMAGRPTPHLTPPPPAPRVDATGATRHVPTAATHSAPCRTRCAPVEAQSLAHRWRAKGRNEAPCDLAKTTPPPRDDDDTSPLA